MRKKTKQEIALNNLKLDRELDSWFIEVLEEAKEKQKLVDSLYNQRKEILSKFIEYEKLDDKDKRAYTIMIEISNESLDKVIDVLMLDIRNLISKMERIRKVSHKKFEIWGDLNLG